MHTYIHIFLYIYIQIYAYTYYDNIYIYMCVFSCFTIFMLVYQSLTNNIGTPNQISINSSEIRWHILKSNPLLGSHWIWMDMVHVDTMWMLSKVYHGLTLAELNTFDAKEQVCKKWDGDTPIWTFVQFQAENNETRWLIKQWLYTVTYLISRGMKRALFLKFDDIFVLVILRFFGRRPRRESFGAWSTTFESCWVTWFLCVATAIVGGTLLGELL